MEGPAHDPLLYPPPSRPATGKSHGSGGGAGGDNRWGPYHNAGDFGANMALVLLILVCTLAFVLAFTATVRFFLRRHRRRRRSPPPAPSADLEKQERAVKGAAPAAAAAVAFTPGMRLAGSAAECAICLAEFAEGEGVRVLPACNHGFHVKCIEAWLASKSSCPTCRCSCRVATSGPPEKSQPPPSEGVL